MFITPGALELFRAFFSTGLEAGPSSIPPIAESTLVRSDVSADMMSELGLMLTR